MILSMLKQHPSSFRRSENGSATVEFTLWVPAFLAIFLLGADASTAFTEQSNFWRVAHETARVVSRHALDAEAGAAFARDQQRIGSYAPDIEVQVDDAIQIVAVSVTAEGGKLAPFGLLSCSMGDQVSFVASQMLEPI